ncbi:amino acid ABC transporter ATP-binding protein [Aliishimia ponticola]|uniref:Amino acid ABC transporter ATP-binding protein n=1 Tax=Aliishimia ponticola TaxID=2499833 RepID=A0A4S4N8P8_9RHOB|nr:amino acid ABC transporter ATP-binding protein [Aliishimia ponticola]THH34361.1 amino acid ABC transporter ATP-binding protein [Aliishimia ponticola]
MPLINIESIHKTFGKLEVLKGVSLDIAAGEIVVIIGRSGSGKSTLLRCINGLEKVESGKVVVDGTEVSAAKADLRALRQKIGIVFQSFNLFPHLTIEKNVTLAPRVVKKVSPDEAKKAAITALERVQIANKSGAYPSQLSGGQQQRVAIARSLAMSPKIMLFDEITSALDPELVGEVLKVLENLASEGMTMVLVTHEMGFARKVANRVVFMHEGKVWEQGAPETLFKSPKTPELAGFINSVL